MVMKLSLDERDEPEFDDFIECCDVRDDVDLMLVLTDNVSSLSSANTLLNAAVCTAWIESLIEESSSTMSSDSGVCFTRSSQLFIVRGPESETLPTLGDFCRHVSFHWLVGGCGCAATFFSSAKSHRLPTPRGELTSSETPLLTKITLRVI